MGSGLIVDLYGSITLTRICVSQYPREAVVQFELKGRPESIIIANPEPLNALMAALENCYGIRVFDRNIEEGNCLEFGRYRVEFWDEDNPIADLLADGFTPSFTDFD